MTPKELAQETVTLYRDKVIGEETAERLNAAIFSAIAAAVAAEHRATLEQAAQVAEDMAERGNGSHSGFAKANAIASAIRALK